MYKQFLISSLLLTSICVAGPKKSDNSKEVRPHAVPRYDNDVFFETDFIYWWAKQEGNNYATTGSAITVPGTTFGGATPGPLTGKGRIFSPDNRMNPGFKAALGINLKHGGWDVISEYTYLHCKGSGEVSSTNQNAGILPIFSFTPHNSVLSTATFAGGTTGFVSNASTNWHLHFNNINLELGRMMRVMPFLSLRPHFGLQASWQKQIFKANYQVASVAAASTILGKNQVAFKQDFWGFGIRAGLDTTWRCCHHLSLFGNATVSALWGQFKAHGKSFDTNTAAGTSNVLISNQINRLHTISPVVQVEAGLQTDWIFNDYYRVLGQVGWEEQIWFYQNQHSSTIADTSLVMQGLTIKLRFDF